MVDLLPGRITTSALPGMGSPGRTNTSLTPGSMPSGSRSSKLAMRASTGTAITRDDAERWARSRSTASSAGSHAARGSHGTTPSDGPARQSRHRREALVEQSGIAAKLVDDEAADARALVRLQHQMRAGKTGDHAAAIDVADQHHRHIGRGGKSHIGDIAGAQIDFGRTAGAFDQYDIGLARKLRKTVQYRRQQCRLLVEIVLRPQRAPALALHDDLRTAVGLRLQQHRIHVYARSHSRRARLHRLGAADLAALHRNGRIVRHVLRLERRHLQSAPHQRARQPRDQASTCRRWSRWPGSSARASRKSSELDAFLGLHALRGTDVLSGSFR